MYSANIKGIIFDYGGTIDTHGCHWVHVLRQGWTAAGMHVPEPLFRQAYVMGERAMAREGTVMPCDDFYTLLLLKTRVALKSIEEPARYYAGTRQFDMHSVAADIAAYCDDMAAKRTSESAALLERLQSSYDLCLVSNFYGNLSTVLSAYGLRQYFPHVIESAMVGVRKPDPRIFSIGVTALGLNPGQVLVVGDSIANDIMPALSIGCQALLLDGPGWDSTTTLPAPCRAVSTLDALADTLLN